jgi:NADH:ubiquinone oxidoreductase subunit
MYNGLAEPSKVPPVWHGWLHYTSDVIPDKHPLEYAWQKEAQPNLTGTTLAYVPPGHVSRGGKRAATIADYEAWKP